LSDIELVERAESEVVDETAQFFAPVSSDIFNELIGQYQSMRTRVEAVAAMVQDETAAAMDYFLDGNSDPQNGRYSVAAKKLFQLKGAIACLNAAYWSKTLALTDVLDMMPQKRRDEWNKTIREMTAPDFTEEAVRPTITELLNMRTQFLSERVDGIFRGLSGEHVTNAPEAFGKRMIVARVLSAYDTSDHSTCGLINDLRCVVSKFMGRQEPGWHATSDLIPILKRRWGEWVTIDGGAIKIRLYKKGTAHMEVHPDMAWRLNSILANLYPLAIPAQFRQKPKRRVKDFEMMARPLPFAVLALLGGMRVASERVGTGWPEKFRHIENSRKFDSGRHIGGVDEAGRVLQSIGGVPCGNGTYYQFDYDPTTVLDDIVASGCIPDQKAHQFYPTPETLARIAVELADIGDADLVLEPSAGQGGLADFLPKGRTTCIEIAPLNCAVLKSKGHNVIEGDFIVWADLKPYETCFDVVVMNPPFSEGRAKLHTEYASTKVNPGGRLVSILPASFKGKNLLGSTWEQEWSPVYENEFAGTSVAVTILKATRGAA
jgi:hypothetical protein